MDAGSWSDRLLCFDQIVAGLFELCFSGRDLPGVALVFRLCEAFLAFGYFALRIPDASVALLGEGSVGVMGFVCCEGPLESGDFPASAVGGCV